MLLKLTGKILLAWGVAHAVVSLLSESLWNTISASILIGIGATLEVLDNREGR